MPQMNEFRSETADDSWFAGIVGLWPQDDWFLITNGNTCMNSVLLKSSLCLIFITMHKC